VDGGTFGVDIVANKAMDGVGVDLHTEDKPAAGADGETVLMFNMFKAGKKC
jgi:hypothetical protein